MTVETWTTSGSFHWTAPADVVSVIAEAWGAGGGGRKGYEGEPGGGGGGGGYSKKTITVSPGIEYDLNVGSGGTGGTSPTPGADSWFSSSATVMAKGGGAGDLGLGGTGGAAGSGVGTTKYSGGNGFGGFGTLGGGGGGSAGTSSNGNSATDENGAAAVSGGGAGGDMLSDGEAPGGGGGGAYSVGAAGNGADGKVKITYTATPSETNRVKNVCEMM